MKRKFIAIIMCCLLAVGAVGCGTDAENEAEKVTITVFNSKIELQENFEELAAKYSEENDVNVEVYYSNDTVAAHLSAKYASGEPYTINMVDAKDIYLLGKEYGYDMTGQDWTKDTDYSIAVDDKVVGFPVCIEARGLLYNAAAYKKALGEDFNPENLKTAEDLDNMCQKLQKAGVEYPTGILKPDWSLGAHYFQQIYEEREDADAFVNALYAGEVDLMEDAKFNSVMDTFDVLKKYNLFQDSPLTVEDEEVHMALSEGQDVFQFGGCWEWNDIIDFDYTGEIGLMPLPQTIDDGYSDSIVGGCTKYFYIDNSEYTNETQQKAAEDFLNYLVYSDEGKQFVSDTCAMISPFKNNDVKCANEIGVYVKKYVDEGKMIKSYDYDPDNHYSQVGAIMQKYLADEIDRAELAKEVESYWANEGKNN